MISSPKLSRATGRIKSARRPTQVRLLTLKNLVFTMQVPRASKERDVVGFEPKEMFFTKGVGKHREKLTSFELALRDARIAEFNLVRVSSIFPPNCRVISIQDGLKTLSPGQIVFAVMYDNATNEPHRLVAASVGLAIPADKSSYGYLSEHKSFGQTDQKAGDYAEDLAATMLATSLGVDFDPNVSYDERKDIWKLSDKIVQTRNITQSAIGDRDGLWTTVVAAAVFCDLPSNGK
jgi:arginine decarboxylase